MKSHVNEEELELNELMAEIDGVLSKSKDTALIRRAESDVQYSTGFLPVDYKNGHRVKVNLPDGNIAEYDSVGIVDGTNVQIIGRSGCGKSTFAFQMGMNIIRDFPNGLMFVDLLEGGMMEDRACSICDITKEEYYAKVKVRNAGITIESVYAQIKAIHDVKVSHEDKFSYNTGIIDSNGRPITKFQPTVYLIDSIPLLTSAKLSEEEQLSGQMSTTATAKQLAQLYRRTNQLLKRANIILISINHITQKIEINAFTHTKAQTSYLKQDENLPGGVTPLYLANTVLRLDDGTKITEDKEFGINGIHVVVSNVKSRAGMSGMSSAVDLIFDYASGFDPDLSMYMMLKNAGYVNGAGAYLYLCDRDDKKFSQRGFKQKLIDDPEFCEVFTEACFKYLYNELSHLEEVASVPKSSATKSIMDRVRKMNIIQTQASA